MIKINFYKNGFQVSGHAEFDEYGKDILCSAVSAIIMGSLNWFDTDKVNISVLKNEIKLISNLEDNNSLHLIELVKVQIKSLDLIKHKDYIMFNEFKEIIRKDKNEKQ